MILINEARRIFHFPAITIPEDRKLLDSEGKARDKEGKPVKVRRFKAPMLEPGARIDVPDWYFEQLLRIRQLAAIFKAKTGGIACGRSSAERAVDQTHERSAELEAQARELEARASLAVERAARLEQEISEAREREAALEARLVRLEAALTAAKGTDPAAKVEPTPTPPAARPPESSGQGERSRRNG